MEYTTDDIDNNARVEAEVRIVDEDGDNELNGNNFVVTYSPNLNQFFDEDIDPVITTNNTEYDYSRNFESLPSIQTNGTITFTVQPDTDPLRHKAVVSIDDIVNGTEWKAYYNVAGTLIEFDGVEVAKLFTGQTTDYGDIFITPNFDNETEPLVIAEDDDISVSASVGDVSIRRITGLSDEVNFKPADVIDPDDEDNNIVYSTEDFLLGSYVIEGTSAIATMADDRDDTSNDQNIDLTVTVTTTDYDVFSLTYDDPDDDPDAGPVTAVGTTRVEGDVIKYTDVNFRNVRYAVTKQGETDETTDVSFEEFSSNSNIAPDNDLTVQVDSGADPGNYTVTFTPQTSGLWRGTAEDLGTYTLTINVPTP